MSRISRPIRSFLGLASAVIAAFLLLPVAAGQADVLAQSDCTPGSSSQAFAPWGDNAYYELVPGGDFEGSLAGWTLLNGAARVSGSETFGVTGSVGSYSLGLSTGSVAVSPPACVNVANPTVEFFSQTQTPGATVVVGAVYQRANGRLMTVPVGTVSPGSTWAPSGPLTVNTPNSNANGNLLIALALTVTGGSAQVDDLYIDPWYRG